jgi:hypothetical protein
MDLLQTMYLLDNLYKIKKKFKKLYKKIKRLILNYLLRLDSGSLDTFLNIFIRTFFLN